MKVTFRDTIAVKVCNWILTTFCSTEYLARLYIVNDLGLKAYGEKFVRGEG